jgi:hypothetical protein
MRTPPGKPLLGCHAWDGARGPRPRGPPHAGDGPPPLRPAANSLLRASMRALRECARSSCASGPATASGGWRQVYPRNRVKSRLPARHELRQILAWKAGGRAVSRWPVRRDRSVSMLLRSVSALAGFVTATLPSMRTSGWPSLCAASLRCRSALQMLGVTRAAAQELRSAPLWRAAEQGVCSACRWAPVHGASYWMLSRQDPHVCQAYNG